MSDQFLFAKSFIHSLNLEIQSHMMNGQISYAIQLVNTLHPGLLESDKELMFQVCCRQFVETIAGYDRLPAAGPGEQNGGQCNEEDMETENSTGIT